MITNVAPLLEFVGASKTFEAVVAVAPLDLSVAPGDTLVLIGPSGCGKTTVLRMALGLLWPDAGQVRFRGEVLSPNNVQLARRSMGYVVQEGGLFPHLTAGQNVSLMARHLRWPRARIEQRQAELATLTRFPLDALGRYPIQLSGGQRQRVGLMRALMLDPDLLLFDEPLGAIDPLVRAELQQDLVRIFQQTAKTVVLVTHDLSEAAFFARDQGQVALLQQGRVLQRGRVEELVRSPSDPFITKFVAAQPLLAFGHAPRAQDDGRCAPAERERPARGEAEHDRNPKGEPQSR
jgi:osmoprotectant transport system ATP-binding protein